MYSLLLLRRYLYFLFGLYLQLVQFPLFLSCFSEILRHSIRDGT